MLKWVAEYRSAGEHMWHRVKMFRTRKDAYYFVNAQSDCWKLWNVRRVDPLSD